MTAMSIPLFRLGHAEVRVHVTFLAAGIILASSGFALHLAIFAGSLIFHEMGHLAGALWMGAEITRIEVWPFGAVAKLEQSWQLSPVSETLVALMGPLNSGILASLASLAGQGLARLHGNGVSLPLLNALVGFNMSLFVLNFIPCLPLDGGRILRSQLAMKLGYREATCKVAALGMWVGISMTVLGFAGIGCGVPWYPALILGPLIAWSAAEERMSAVAGNILEILARSDRLRQRKVIPVEEILVSADASVGQVVATFRPSRYHMILVAGKNMKVLGRLPETRVLEAYYRGRTNLRMKDFRDSFL